jgi:primosomal protein N' (replication factor Y)
MMLFDDKIISVAVPRPLPGLFTYKIADILVPHVRLGGWVKVPFGRSITHAFVVELPKASAEIPVGLSVEHLKSVLEVSDSGLVFPKDILALCHWAHEYYFSPLGEVLNCAAPAASLGLKKLKRSSKKINLSHAAVPAHSLTLDQLFALAELEKFRAEGPGKVALLKGVTGSGKTEIYIELAKKTLANGKGVLILVPEIGLTPQLHRRFEASLGVPIALWHSAVSDGKRRDQSVALQNGELQVVVGARSAVFAPIQNLGLIVVDEEHDPTYKQEDRMKYHARDLAVVRSKLTGAFAVLGSATPSFETRERVREGRYSLATLDKRIAPGGLPQIELVDLRVESQVKKTQAPLANKTIKAIQDAVLAGEQVIIYLNRRGFASFLLCKDCGEVKGCPQCSISLTVHRLRPRLCCHVCDYSEAIPDFCGKCQSTELHAMGAGTESLEAEIPLLISGAKVLRLDRDQVTSTTRLNKILDEFRNGEANILLGTQMIVKGHDFPGVTLVVVVLADSLFRWPDFRAPERAFQILKQVAGRAGRGEKTGKVLIQTYDPSHPVLQTIVGEVSEESFLESERELRQALGYPPFGRLARIRFENPSRVDAMNRAKEVVQQMQLLFVRELAPDENMNRGLDLLGPSDAFMEKAKGIYRWDLLLKSKKVETLQRALNFAREYCATRKWQYLIDIDPYGI